MIIECVYNLVRDASDCSGSHLLRRGEGHGRFVTMHFEILITASHYKIVLCSNSFSEAMTAQLYDVLTTNVWKEQ